MSVKSVLFSGTITSSGIVNFDGKPSWLVQQALRDKLEGKWYGNIKIAKHFITRNGVDKEGNPKYNAVLKISKDCLRNGIFQNDQPFHNPGIVHAEKVLIELLASAAGLLRGYMFTDKVIKRKSPVYISDARQISDNVSTIDITTQTCPKDSKADADSEGGLAMHFKETAGGLTTYEFFGSLDLSELQFISLSQVYDRLAIDPNHLEAYTKALEKTFGSEVKGKSFYIKSTSTNGLPEEGILLTSEQTKKLIGEFFSRLFDLEIIRGANGRAWLSSLKIMPRNGGLDYNQTGITVKTVGEVLEAVGDVHTFYTAYNEEEAKKLYDSIDLGKNTTSADKKAIKEAKKAEKAAAKAAKEASKAEAESETITPEDETSED
jgi:hypothetical protein